MAVTLNSTGITFSNGQTLATNVPTGTLTTFQYTAYATANFYNQQLLSTSDSGVQASHPFGFYPGYSFTMAGTLIVGSTWYRSGGNVNNSPGTAADQGTAPTGSGPDGAGVSYRTVYRTINGL